MSKEPIEKQKASDKASEIADAAVESKANTQFEESLEGRVDSGTVVNMKNYRNDEDTDAVFSLVIDVPIHGEQELFFTDEDLSSGRADYFFEYFGTTIEEMEILGESMTIVYRNGDWIALLEENMELKVPYKKTSKFLRLTNKAGVVPRDWVLMTFFTGVFFLFILSLVTIPSAVFMGFLLALGVAAVQLFSMIGTSEKAAFVLG